VIHSVHMSSITNSGSIVHTQTGDYSWWSMGLRSRVESEGCGSPRTVPVRYLVLTGNKRVLRIWGTITMQRSIQKHCMSSVRTHPYMTLPMGRLAADDPTARCNSIDFAALQGLIRRFVLYKGSRVPLRVVLFV